MRLRLIIPAAVAAAATYAALMRDEELRHAPYAAPSPDEPIDPGSEAGPELPHVGELHTDWSRVAVEVPGAPVTPPRVDNRVTDAAPDPAATPETAVATGDLGGEAPDEHTGGTERAPDDETPSPEGQVLDEGRFAIGGWAAAPGHSVVSAVTYRRRLPVVVPADRVVLTIEAAENVPDGGLVVLADPGFAPDREGFTLLLAAADPGPFSAAGAYRVIG